MSKTILLNHSNWHFTKENPGIPAAVMGEAIALPTPGTRWTVRTAATITTAAPAGIHWP